MPAMPRLTVLLLAARPDHDDVTVIMQLPVRGPAAEPGATFTFARPAVTCTLPRVPGR
jgi:hypothetical protein